MIPLYETTIGISATGSGTVVKSAPGYLLAISVLASGSAVGGVYDANAVSGATVLGPQFAIIPQATGFVPNIPHIGWYCDQGIVVFPGTGQLVCVEFQ
jgi:hypothetical protein